MKKSLLTLLLAAFLSSGLSAQQAYRGAIECGFGPSIGYYNVSGEVKNVVGTAAGGNCFLRYTHYIKNGFGVFGEVRNVFVNAEDYQYFNALNKADGGKYRYRFDYRQFNVDYNPFITIGGAYRKVWERFDLVFRAGIGYGERTNNFCYERMARDGSSGPEYYDISALGSSVDSDYLISGGYQFYYVPAFVVSGSAQFVLKTKKSIFFFGELGFDASPSRYTATSVYYASKKGYDPSNWVEAVAFSDYKDSWTIDQASKKVTYPKYGMGAHINITFGIGFNLWRSR